MQVAVNENHLIGQTVGPLSETNVYKEHCLIFCSLSEDDLWLGQWRNANKDTKQPDIMSDADAYDVRRRVLKEYILKMTSFFPKMRPKITEVYEFITQLIKGPKGESTKRLNIIKMFVIITWA